MRRVLALTSIAIWASMAQAADYKPWSDTKIVTINFSFPEEVGVKAVTTGRTMDARIMDGADLVGFAVTNGSSQNYPAGFVGLTVQPQYQNENGGVQLLGSGDNKINGKIVDDGVWVSDTTNKGRWLTKKNVPGKQESDALRIVAAGAQTVEPGEYSIGVSAVHRTE